MTHSITCSAVMQVSAVASRALDLLTQAGVTLVPFDSQALNDVSADAWGTGTESYAFEDTDTLARYIRTACMQFVLLIILTDCTCLSHCNRKLCRCRYRFSGKVCMYCYAVLACAVSNIATFCCLYRS